MTIQAFHERDVVLHIGTHKTGTTSFQAVLASTASPLADLGVHVFRSQVSDIASWSHELPLIAVRRELTFPLRCMFPDSTLPSMQSEMRQHVISEMQSTAQRVIASHEALSFVRTPREVETLVDVLDARSCRVVVVLRDPESFLGSWKRQLATMGYATNSPYPDSYMNTDFSSWLTEWDVMIDAYAAVIGHEAITVLDYESEVRSRGTIIDGLWSACGLPSVLKPNADVPWLNRSRP
jgi:hypothetical protein